MIEKLLSTDRRARRPHVCNYCGHEIAKGEVYHLETNKYDGEIYTWKCHKRCQDIVAEIWDFVDPDPGMGDTDFHDGLWEVANAFICPDCPFHDTDSDDCDCWFEPKCLDHIHEFFQQWELEMRVPYQWGVKRKGGAK